MKTILQETCGISSGFNRCMACGCGKFQESLSTVNVCVCGHSYIDHRFYESCHPHQSILPLMKTSSCLHRDDAERKTLARSARMQCSDLQPKSK